MIPIGMMSALVLAVFGSMCMFVLCFLLLENPTPLNAPLWTDGKYLYPGSRSPQMGYEARDAVQRASASQRTEYAMSSRHSDMMSVVSSQCVQTRPSWNPPPSQGGLSSQGLMSQRPEGLGSYSGNLCPALVLSHCDTCFAVEIEEITKADGPFSILGLSGNPVLRGFLRHDSLGHAMDISMSDRSPVVATVVEVGDEIRFAQGQALFEVRTGDGIVFGGMVRSSEGRHLLLNDREMLLQVDVESATGQLILLRRDQPVAFASRGARHGSATLEVRVLAGADAVLVLACVLGIARFGRKFIA